MRAVTMLQQIHACHKSIMDAVRMLWEWCVCHCLLWLPCLIGGVAIGSNGLNTRCVGVLGKQHFGTIRYHLSYSINKIVCLFYF